MRRYCSFHPVLLLTVALVASLCATVFSASADTDRNNVIWFDKAADAFGVKSPLQSWKIENPDRTHKPNPDQAWEKYALPLGNGFIGAMSYGGIETERIQFNEHSLWSGGPGSEGWTADNNKHDAYKHLPEIRKALLAGDTKTAQDLSTEHLRGLGSSDRQIADITFGRYQTFGELTIDTGHKLPETVEATIQGYTRSLDLSTGLLTVEYPHNNAVFTRESFCSYPDRCLVVHFTANKPGLQNLRLKLSSPHQLESKNKDGLFVAAGTLDNNGLKLETRMAVLHDGGTVEIDSDAIAVDSASDVTFILVAATDYAQNPPSWRGSHPAVSNTKHLNAAIKLGFKKLRQRHLADHKSLFGRVAIDLGTTPADIAALPTDQRVAQNKGTPDIDLEELYFQFGRYLLIASSRPGSLPANLQGIWCNEIVPAWNSDYHLNINLQMNYWPSGPCNLLECQEPLIKYTDMLRGPGAVTAKAYNNAAGWTSHLSSNIWGRTVPHPGKNRPRYWAYFPLGGAWLTTHAWEQYAFGGDTDYLRSESWPIIAGTADFLVDYLYELPTGQLSSTPSWSPEHGPISKGTTCDIAMAREALTGAIAAADILGETGPRIEAWKTAVAKLVPYKIGKHGQLQEWYEDIDKPSDQHRHLNHLFGLHPGSQISQAHTPDLFKAAKVSLTQRGDGATGWSMGWKINFWARAQDGDHAYTLVRNLLTRGTNPNLFDVHPPFQIDGNFGGCAGIAEMLMQSHYRKDGGEIDLLAALPKAWPTGSAKGLRARGGFTVNINWKDGTLTEANITADKDSKLIVRCKGKKWEFDMAAGRTVTVLATAVSVEHPPAREITHRVMVQPIVARDDNGLHPAKCHIDETLIDQVYGGIGIDFYFLKTVYYDNNDVLKGKKDVNIIVEGAKEAGLLKGNGQIINLFFVDCINGKPAPRGLGQCPGWLVFIAMGKDVPEGQDAFVVAHECAHNLGLGHAVDDPNVPNDIPNVMGDGPFIDRVGPKGLTEYQAALIFKSPLVKPVVECLDRDAAAKAITDESVEPYFSILQRREISALLGQSLPSDWTLEQCRDEVKRDFQAATLDFTEEERQSLTQIAARINVMLNKDFPLFTHQPWRFIKVKNDHCGGMAYTRSDCVILNQKMVAQICKTGEGSNKAATLQRRTSLLVHEQLHVLQRFHPDRFAPLYEGTWGFQPGQVTPNPWLNKHQITNPDAPANDWITECTTDQGTRQLLWMRTLIMGTEEVPRLGRDFEAVAVHLEKTEKGFSAICNPNGKPVYEPMSDYSEYGERFSSAAKRGLDHPHEIAAYAFAELFLNEYVQTEPLREEPDQQAFWNSFRSWGRTHLN